MGNDFRKYKTLIILLGSQNTSEAATTMHKVRESFAFCSNPLCLLRAVSMGGTLQLSRLRIAGKYDKQIINEAKIATMQRPMFQSSISRISQAANNSEAPTDIPDIQTRTMPQM